MTSINRLRQDSTDVCCTESSEADVTLCLSAIIGTKKGEKRKKEMQKDRMVQTGTANKARGYASSSSCSLPSGTKKKKRKIDWLCVRLRTSHTHTQTRILCASTQTSTQKRREEHKNDDTNHSNMFRSFSVALLIGKKHRVVHGMVLFRVVE